MVSLYMGGFEAQRSFHRVTKCQAPIPDPTRLADPNRVRSARLRTGTLYLTFFLNRTGTCGYGPHLITIQNIIYI